MLAALRGASRLGVDDDDERLLGLHAERVDDLHRDAIPAFPPWGAKKHAELLLEPDAARERAAQDRPLRRQYSAERRELGPVEPSDLPWPQEQRLDRELLRHDERRLERRRPRL